MTAPDHLRITGPEDILGFIPHSLGYWPEDSLVAMTMQGKRLGATLRVDLPAPDSKASGGSRGDSNGAGGGDPAAGGRSSVPERKSGSRRADTFAGFARNVVSYLQADDAADGSLLAFFTDTDANSDASAWADLLKELELALEAAGMPLRDAWIVGAEFWRNAYCTDPECCEPPGRPIEQIRNSRLNAEMVFRGSSVGAAPGSQGTKPAPPSVDPAVRAAEAGWAEQFSVRRRDRSQFAQVLDVWTTVLQDIGLSAAGTIARGRTAAGNHDAGNRAAQNRDAGNHDARNHDARNHDAQNPDAVTADRAPELSPQLSPELAGYLRASLCVAAWRDAVLVMAAAGRRAAERGAEDFGMFGADAGSAFTPGTKSSPRPRPTPSPIPEPISGSASGSASGSTTGSASGAGPDSEGIPGYGEVLLGLAPSIPNWATMVGLERVLELLGGIGVGESTAAAVTARGWIEWCRGRGSYADALYRQALQDHPGYRLAELLEELGRRGSICGWAARREAAWQKFTPDAA
jgi:hypothetical protein